MKKLLFGLSCIVMTAIFIVSCSKEETFIKADIESTAIETRAPHGYRNEIFRDLSRVVSIGVNDNKVLRKVLKKKALLMFDGDFDVLLNTIKDKNINVNGQPKTIKRYLGDIYNTLGLGVNTSFSGAGGNGYNTGDSNGGDGDGGQGGAYETDPEKIIETIISIYPEIQISIPVHAEDWDVVNYIPKVIFIDEDHNEPTSLIHEGYLNDSEIQLSVVDPPDNPALVIGLCERLDGGFILKKLTNMTLALTSTPSATGISHLWTVQNPDNDEIMGYRIYRKDLIMQNFEMVAEILDDENTAYNDFTVNPNVQYFYYVKAFNAIEESDKSNTTQTLAPSVPGGAATFSATLHATDDLEIRWSHDPSSYIESSTLERKVVGQGGYQFVQTFPYGVYDYFEPDVQEGKQVIYKFYETNSQGNSNYKHDIVEIPYRDVSQPSPVRIAKIEYDPDQLEEIEGWGMGAPEFNIGIAKSNSAGTSSVVQNNLQYSMWPPIINIYDLEVDELVYNWHTLDWMEVMTFEVVERDDGPDHDFEIDIPVVSKKLDKTGFVNSIVTDVLKKFLDNSDDEVGRMTHRYVDEPNSVLEFPKGGFKIYLSE